VARLDSVDRDLGGRDATQCGRGHGHLGRQRLSGQQLSKLSALLVDVGAGRKGRLSQDRVETLSLLGAH
jgi:hypothetical protein